MDTTAAIDALRRQKQRGLELASDTATEATSMAGGKAWNKKTKIRRLT